MKIVKNSPVRVGVVGCGVVADYGHIPAINRCAEAKLVADLVHENIVQIYQLGKDEDVLEQARAGANVAVLVDGGRLAEVTPEDVERIIEVAAGAIEQSGHEAFTLVDDEPRAVAFMDPARLVAWQHVLLFLCVLY